MRLGNKVALITGGGRGIGKAIALAYAREGAALALCARTGAELDKTCSEIRSLNAECATWTCDVSLEESVRELVANVTRKFSRIDVLVNNAGNFKAGYFEELTPEQIERQLATTLLGPMNVTRAVLPVMRRQHSGHIISISSSAGLLGFEFCSAYAASKFGIEGWMESLRPEIAPFGIHTTVVNPGFFRTELLTKESTTYAELSIQDYTSRRTEQLKWWQAQNGQQSGDPAKLAKALITIAGQEPPPGRFIAGADAMALAEQKLAALREQIDANRGLSTSMALDQPAPAGGAR